MQEGEPFELSSSMRHSVRNGLHSGISILLVWRGKRPKNGLSVVKDIAVRGDGKRLQGTTIASSWSVVRRGNSGGRQVLLGDFFSRLEDALSKRHFENEGRKAASLVVNVDEWLPIVVVGRLPLIGEEVKTIVAGMSE